MPEQQNIEYKSSWHDDYLKCPESFRDCGFTNAVGGKIYIGKDDDGNIIHLKDYKQLMESIPQKIRNTITSKNGLVERLVEGLVDSKKMIVKLIT